MDAGPSVEPTTVGELLERALRVAPEREAITDGLVRVSWRELAERAESVCIQLRNAGVEPGDRIAVVLPNRLEAVVMLWACALSGTIFTGINPQWSADDVRSAVAHADPRLVVLTDALADAIPRERRRDVVVVGRGDSDFFTHRAAFPPEERPRLSADDVFAILYTSGTTDRAKGVVLTHGNLSWNSAVSADRLRMCADDVMLATTQITHIFGLSATLLVAAQVAARTVLMRAHAAGPALDLCEWERVTVHHGTPTMFALEIAAQERAPRDLSSLRTGIVAAATVEPELVDAIRSTLSCDIQIAWGLTETSPAVTMTAFDDPPEKRCVTVGRPLPDVELRIDRTDGGEYGEILVRSPGVFREYYRNPQLTNATFTDDGYMRTGDLGWLDDEGFLHLTGRKKEIIIRAGMHVYPDELEALLRRLPWIEQVAVVGIPDRVLGERICACVVVREGAGLPADMLAEVRSALAERIAPYKLPDVVLRVPELPRTPAGKLLRRVLREDAIARTAAG
jgi:fatty-acyl-CoA synthase